MAEPLKFTFDTAFGTRSENEPVNESLPVITQADVDAARTQGFIQGREDGLAEASAQFNSESKATFDKIGNGLAKLMAGQAKTATDAIEQAENYALLIAQKIAKAALMQHPTLQVKALIDDCLSHINLMPHLVVRVNESMSQMIQTELQPIIAEKGFEGKLIIMGEENIALGDCAIEWADGGVAHNTQEIVKTISNKLVEYFGFDVEAIQADNAPALSPADYELLDEDTNDDDDDDDGDIFAADEDEFEVLESPLDTPLNTQNDVAETKLDTDGFDDLIDPDELNASGDDAGFFEVVQKEQAEQMAPEIAEPTDLEGQTNE